MARIDIPSVTLCAAASVNVAATVAALRASLEQAEFADCLLFTDAVLAEPEPGIRVIPIPALGSSRDYSEFILTGLADHVRTSHCLVVQWDGFVQDGSRWDPTFLDHDYIGALWPQFDDGHRVGNGGFSLRSRKLLDACRDPRFQVHHPEDLAIGRINRELLEREHGIRFANPEIARRFAYERLPSDGPTFGFHGVFNMIEALGAERFWQVYLSLDDRSTAFVDFGRIFRQLGQGRGANARRARFTWDRLASLFGR